jgi:uncharacterized protein YpmB
MENINTETEKDVLMKLLLDTNKMQNKMIKHFRILILVIVISFSLIICSMVVGFFWYESQFDTTTTTTTTDMETQGENANINNVTSGDMYNDNAVHNEG